MGLLRSPAWAVLLLAAAVPLALARNGAFDGATDVEGRAPFPGSAPSLEALAETVLRGLADGDTVALERVRLTEEEHNEVVWPELPAGAPAIGFPVDFAWENIQMRNRRALGRMLPGYRGREVTLHGVRCRGGTEVFRTFHVQTDCRVVFIVPGGGRVEARIFKDVLVRHGGYKIFRYYEDGARIVPTG